MGDDWGELTNALNLIRDVKEPLGLKIQDPPERNVEEVLGMVGFAAKIQQIKGIIEERKEDQKPKNEQYEAELADAAAAGGEQKAAAAERAEERTEERTEVANAWKLQRQQAAEATEARAMANELVKQTFNKYRDEVNTNLETAAANAAEEKAVAADVSVTRAAARAKAKADAAKADADAAETAETADETDAADAAGGASKTQAPPDLEMLFAKLRF